MLQANSQKWPFFQSQQNEEKRLENQMFAVSARNTGACRDEQFGRSFVVYHCLPGFFEIPWSPWSNYLRRSKIGALLSKLLRRCLDPHRVLLYNEGLGSQQSYLKKAVLPARKPAGTPKKYCLKKTVCLSRWERWPTALLGFQPLCYHKTSLTGGMDDARGFWETPRRKRKKLPVSLKVLVLWFVEIWFGCIVLVWFGFLLFGLCLFGLLLLELCFGLSD